MTQSRWQGVNHTISSLLKLSRMLTLPFSLSRCSPTHSYSQHRTDQPYFLASVKNKTRRKKAGWNTSQQVLLTPTHKLTVRPGVHRPPDFAGEASTMVLGREAFYNWPGDQKEPGKRSVQKHCDILNFLKKKFGLF